MSQQFLDGANVFAIFEQMCGETMSQRVAGHFLGESRFSGGRGDCLLDARFVQVMPANLGRRTRAAFVLVGCGRFVGFARPRVGTQLAGWEEVLPRQRAASDWILRANA